MAEIDNIVDVQITAETTTVTTASFNIPLLMAKFTEWTDSRTRTYGSLVDVQADFATTTNVYKMASKLFGQPQVPTQIIVGRIAAADTDYAASYAAIKAENNTFFGVVAESHLAADVLSLAAVIEADAKIYGVGTQEAAALTTATTDIGSQLKALGYSQTYVIYGAAADTQWPEAAWMGSQLTYTPGSNTWKFKTLIGVTVDALTGTQIANLRTKNINFYIPVGGVSITEDGKMANGRWIDEIVGVFWTEARMQESVFGMLVNKPKVPYTSAGFALVEAQMRSVLSQGVNNGLYSSFTINTPSISSIPVNQRNLRIAGDFTFTAVLAGAVHEVIIRGTVTV